MYHHLWKEGQVTQELFEDVARSCRKKSREIKVQLELNRATSVKDNNFFFFNKYKNGKRRGKDNLHSLLDAGGI